MPSNSQESMKSYITRSKPFGPISTDDIREHKVVEALFDRSPELHERITLENPAFLIGRRGSGKTAFLRAVNESGGIVIELDTAKVLSSVTRTLDILSKKGEPLFVEDIVRVWDAAFLSALTEYVATGKCKLPRDNLQRSYQFGSFPDVAQDKSDSILTQYLFHVRTEANRLGDWPSLDFLLESVSLNTISLGSVRAEFEAAIPAADCDIRFHLDSLEEYAQTLPTARDDSRIRALQGLFSIAGHLSAASEPLYKLRISVPAELWNVLSDLASNPTKDFQHSISLHWNGSELIHLAALRLQRFLNIYYPTVASRLHALRYPSRNRWRWSQEFLRHFLPEMIVNDFRQQERCIPYILRHTQMLPRHFLEILNAIFSTYDFTIDSYRRVSAEEVKKGIKNSEQRIVQGINKAYVLPYPKLDSVCDRVIRHLPLSFEYGLLHRIRNQEAKDISFDEVLRMLIESGAIGRVTKESTTYIEGEFEYLVEHKVLVTEIDTLCLHPLFAEIYDCITRRQPRADVRPVYPLGAYDIMKDRGEPVHVLR